MSSKSSDRYPPELREWAVRLVLKQRRASACTQDAIRAIAPRIGCHVDTLRLWLRHYEQEQQPCAVDDGLNLNERQRLNALEREVRELRRSNAILRQSSAYFAQAELDLHWKK